MKYLIQYQVFITYVNVGFQALLSRPDIKLPSFIQNIIDVLKRLDDHINALLQPFVDFVKWAWSILVGPLQQLWDSICNGVGYVLSPLQYPMAYVVVIVGNVLLFLFKAIHHIFTFIIWCLYHVYNAIYISSSVIYSAIVWIIENLMVTPIVWSWDNIIVLPCATITNGLISSLGIFQMCFDYFCFSTEGMEDVYGWMEVSL